MSIRLSLIYLAFISIPRGVSPFYISVGVFPESLIHFDSAEVASILLKALSAVTILLL